MPNKITAVVVSYNRKELLVDCIKSILSQTRKPDQVVIINNASTDGTLDTLKSMGYTTNPCIFIISMEKNIGGAGGFHEGIKYAYNNNADWIWCMDDDCIPYPDALELLLAPIYLKEIQEIGFLASRVLWTDGNPCLMNLPVAHPLWIQSHSVSYELSRIIGSSFVSMLINREAIEKVGYPVKEFFIWFDDAEYSRRISSNLNSYLVASSVVLHKTASNLTPLDFNFLDGNSLWKYKLGIRNETSFHRYSGGRIKSIIFILRIIKNLINIPRKKQFLFPIIVSAITGWFFDYTKYIRKP